jgi:hypothetical protein
MDRVLNDGRQRKYSDNVIAHLNEDIQSRPIQNVDEEYVMLNERRQDRHVLKEQQQYIQPVYNSEI